MVNISYRKKDTVICEKLCRRIIFIFELSSDVVISLFCSSQIYIVDKSVVIILLQSGEMKAFTCSVFIPIKGMIFIVFLDLILILYVPSPKT